MMGHTKELLVLVLVVLCGYIVAGDGSAQVNGSVTTPMTDMEGVTEEDLEDLEETLKGYINQGFRKALPLVTKIGSDPRVSADCSASLLKTALALRRLDPWALRLLDSMAKPPSGIMTGTLGDYGDYDQCLSTEARNLYGEVDFTGQYCTVFFKVPAYVLRRLTHRLAEAGVYLGRRDPIMWQDADPRVLNGLRMGLCIPSKCSKDELNHIIDSFVKKYGVNTNVRDCDVYAPNSYDGVQIAMLSLLGILTFMVIVSSFVDIILRYREKSNESGSCQRGFFVKFLLAFSAVKNTEILLNTKVEQGSDAQRLRCLHGIKVFSALWVILGHTYFYINPNSIRSLYKLMDFSEEFSFALVMNAFPSVSTFLFVSGLLLSFGILKNIKPHHKLHGIAFHLLVRRYIRITIPAIFVVGVFILFPLFVSGPLYHDIAGLQLEGCYKNWWGVLTHTNNFNGIFGMCMAHYWYVSVDYQIYVFIWLIPIIMLRYPRAGFGIALLAAVSSCVGVTIQTYVNHYHPLMLFLDPDSNTTQYTADYVYLRPFAHIGAYSVGIIIGFLVMNYPKAQLNKFLEMILWSLSASSCLYVIFGTHEWISGNLPSPLMAGIYGGFHRTIWSLGVGWLAYACITGRGGFINKFLSWSPFVPLSRLAYSTFLVQSVLFILRAGFSRERLQMHHFFQAKDFLGIAVMSYICAYLVFLLCEAPTVNLEKLIFGTGKKELAKSNASVKQSTSDESSAPPHSPSCTVPVGDLFFPNNGKTNMYPRPQNGVKTNLAV